MSVLGALPATVCSEVKIPKLVNDEQEVHIIVRVLLNVFAKPTYSSDGKLPKLVK